MKKDKIKIAFVGGGIRGIKLLGKLTEMPDVEVTAVCDKYEDRMLGLARGVEEHTGNTPFMTQDYREIITRGNLDAAVVCTSWSTHIPITMAFMEAGVRVAFEVGGCDSLEQCWELIRTYQRTGVECMMLENCCYGKREMMLLNMVRQGFFGEVVHCTGGYLHYLADEILTGKEKRHYRLNNYLNKNCDNYPTHALGPIAQLLSINHGNRFVSLCSVSSKAVGLKAYMQDHDIENKELLDKEFMQGDVITTIIKCAKGESIILTLDTTLPHFRSRNLSVLGTKGKFDENTHSIFEYGIHDSEKPWREYWGNADEYYEKYSHPLWKEYEKTGAQDERTGMDWLILRDFVESVKNETKPTIDVYDAAAWMCITPLSEASIQKGGITVEIPDFTNGQWIEE